MSDQGSPPKEEKPQVATQISILVKDQGDSAITFKVKTTTKLSKIMNAYAQSQQKTVGTLRFFFDGQRIQDEHTPQGLGIEDGDQLDVFLEQLGGSL